MSACNYHPLKQTGRSFKNADQVVSLRCSNPSVTLSAAARRRDSGSAWPHTAGPPRRHLPFHCLSCARLSLSPTSAFREQFKLSLPEDPCSPSPHCLQTPTKLASFPQCLTENAAPQWTFPALNHNAPSQARSRVILFCASCLLALITI